MLSVQNTHSTLYVSQEQKCFAVVHILVVLVQWEGDECKQMLGQLRGFAMCTITPFLKHLLFLRLFPIEEHAVICLIWFKSHYFWQQLTNCRTLIPVKGNTHKSKRGIGERVLEQREANNHWGKVTKLLCITFNCWLTESEVWSTYLASMAFFCVGLANSDLAQKSVISINNCWKQENMFWNQNEE